MVLQNKHKQLASKQYKKSHGIPLNSSSSSTSTTTTNRPPRETGQERALRLGSNADRYEESDDDLEGIDGDPDEVDEELLGQFLSLPLLHTRDGPLIGVSRSFQLTRKQKKKHYKISYRNKKLN